MQHGCTTLRESDGEDPGGAPLAYSSPSATHYEAPLASINNVRPRFYGIAVAAFATSVRGITQCPSVTVFELGSPSVITVFGSIGTNDVSSPPRVSPPTPDAGMAGMRGRRQVLGIGVVVVEPRRAGARVGVTVDRSRWRLGDCRPLSQPSASGRTPACAAHRRSRRAGSHRLMPPLGASTAGTKSHVRRTVASGQAIGAHAVVKHIRLSTPAALSRAMPRASFSVNPRPAVVRSRGLLPGYPDLPR